MLLAVKELSNYLKHSRQTQLSLHWISMVTDLKLHFIHSTDTFMAAAAIIEVFEALRSNSSLTALRVGSTGLFFISFSRYKGKGIKIPTAGIIKLSEALKSNSTLASLQINCN
jgi:hypothetical protein